ncbi:MAG: extracellular solute-binding protein family 3 [Alphaproteobacteria bacterium]|nr:extracellular solute-binding protein family 3 [Alphaproteobacteria bacterium]
MGHRRGAMIARLLFLLGLIAAEPASARELRVCSDPNNLPFSNERREGFENRIIELIAKDLGASVDYDWRAQRRGVIREALNTGECDIIPGIASGLEMLLTTRPYYRSSYVFVTRASDRLDIKSFDDPRLPALRIGVQMIGDDGSNTPPAHSLARRGMIDNIRGYSILGDYSQPNPPARIVDAVARGEVDVALIWGPLAGYFAPREPVPLVLAPITPWLDGPQWPMVFDISMGVRKGDRALRAELDQALARNREPISRILADYGVPVVTGD